MRSRLDVDAVLQEDVGGPQDVLALVGGIGDVVEAPFAAAMLFGAGKIIGLVVDGEPAAADAAVVELDHLRDAGPEAGLHEAAKRGDVARQEVQVVEPARGGAGEGGGGVLQYGTIRFHLRPVPVRLPVDLEQMAERILEAEGAAMAEIAVAPAVELVAGRFDCRDAALQRFRRSDTIADVAKARPVMARQLERMELVIVPGPQVGGGFILGRELQAIDAGEEVEAVVIAVRVDFHVTEMGDVVTVFHRVLPHNSSTVRGKIDWKPSAYLQSRPPD